MQGVIKTGWGTKLIDLGTATSFNIQTLAPNVDYTKLTINNFFISDVSEYKRTGFTIDAYADRYNGVCNCKIKKTYDATTGILRSSIYYKAYYEDSNGSGIDYANDCPVHCYLIVNPKIA